MPIPAVEGEPAETPATDRARRGWWILLGAIAILHLWNLGAPELTDTDESRSGLIVRDMVEGGHWLLPRTPDGYLSEKPPIYYALSAALVRVFGDHESVLRGVSLAMALATLALTAWLAGLHGSPRAPVIAVAALGANLIFLRWARQAMVDMTLTFGVTAAIVACHAARLGRLRPMTAAVWAGLGTAVAVLTKGPLGFVLPVAVFFAEALLVSRGRFWRLSLPWRSVAAGLAIAIVLPLVWYVAAYRAGGAEFLETCVLSENFRMPVGSAGGIGVAHRRPLPYYFWNQALFLLPMLPLLPLTGRWLGDRDAGIARRSLAIWFGAGFLIFLAAANKRHYYLVPLQPPIAVMIALAADRTVDRKRARLAGGGMAATGILWSLGSLAALAVALRPSWLAAWAPSDVVAAVGRNVGFLIVSGLLCLATGVYLLVSSRQGTARLVPAAVAVCLVTVAANSALVEGITADVAPNRAFVSQAHPIVGSAPAAVVPPFHTYGLHYYWPGPLPECELAATSAPYLFVRRDSLNGLPGAKVLAVRKHHREDWDVLLVRRE